MPFFVPVAILLRREEPGPIFYRGPRISSNHIATMHIDGVIGEPTLQIDSAISRGG